MYWDLPVRHTSDKIHKVKHHHCYQRHCWGKKKKKTIYYTYIMNNVLATQCTMPFLSTQCTMPCTIHFKYIPKSVFCTDFAQTTICFLCGKIFTCDGRRQQTSWDLTNNDHLQGGGILIRHDQINRNLVKRITKYCDMQGKIIRNCRLLSIGSIYKVTC